ncbi:MAG: chemotaxis protein CheW [Isosphaeraceae bacterium]
MSIPSPETSIPPPGTQPGDPSCWNIIGTSGDGSCPELEAHIHCRNCPVFASAARTFFDRQAPDGYLTDWTRWLSGTSELTRNDAQERDRDQVSVLIFRLGQEWLAFRTTTVVEVAIPRPVHRIPHRSNEILIGLVNLRGQLQLCVSLHGLLGIARDGDALALAPGNDPQPADGMKPGSGKDGQGDAGPPPGSRLVVLRDRERSQIWIFPAEEVLGVHRLPRAQVRSVSSSLANPDVSFSQAVLDWRGRNVSFLDEQRVFAALRSIEQ